VIFVPKVRSVFLWDIQNDAISFQKSDWLLFQSLQPGQHTLSHLGELNSLLCNLLAASKHLSLVDYGVRQQKNLRIHPVLLLQDSGKITVLHAQLFK